jgi:hypothetical protein
MLATSFFSQFLGKKFPKMPKNALFVYWRGEVILTLFLGKKRWSKTSFFRLFSSETATVGPFQQFFANHRRKTKNERNKKR